MEEVASPPKRMTRARAAAKDAAANVNPKESAAMAVTKTATTSKPTKAASTATTTRTATTSRAAKRKTRSDENEDEDDLQSEVEQPRAMNKPPKTRGRPKKVAGSEPEPESKPESDDTPAPSSAKPTRPRAKRAATAATAASASKAEPPKTRTSTRTRKTTTDDGNADAPSEPVKKTTRSRATSTAKASTGIVTTSISTEPTPGLKSAVSRPASRIGGVVKKTVTFQEPEKENLVPTAATKGKTNTKTTEPATGMRAKPVRKAAASARATRASTRSTSTSEKRDKSPLSPKKDAQNRSLSRDVDSDDELATLEKTPLKPLMKSPVKPPAKKSDLLPPTTKEGDDHTQETSEPTVAPALGSPARRPPSSPFKDVMKSPAKKVDAVPPLVLPSKDDQQPSQSPSKVSMLQSPAKRPQLPIKSLQPPSQESSENSRSPVKMSLFQSPAKRPTSPFKLQGPSAQSFEDNAKRLFARKTSPVEMVSDEEVQEKLAEQIVEQITEQPETTKTGDEKPEENEVDLESPSLLAFPGRLSAVLPRHADPALRENPLPMKEVPLEQPEPTLAKPAEVQEEVTVQADINEPVVDAMDVDEIEAEVKDENENVASPAPTTPPQSPPKSAINSAFGLRAKDLSDYADESEDELAASAKTLSRLQDDTTVTFSQVPSTPTPSTLKTPRGLPSSAVKAANRAIRSVSKGSRFGFTPLANQLNEWKASSPSKLSNSVQISSPEFKDEGFSLLKENDTAPAESTPSKSFFDEEMKIRCEMENQAAMEAALEADIEAAYGEPEFDDIPITNEDVELAAEADEMSLMEGVQHEETKEFNIHDDSISEASQEYGDENAVPIDPALMASNAHRLDPVTPMRSSAPKALHTVSKVPLKPADDSTPGIFKKRSASASKLPPNRPNGLFRNATVISYSPTKESNKMDIDGEDELQQNPVTPSKTDIWSSMGTPARTPRRDLDNGLLRGAVVFVDVHTSDGADASTVFVELLTQMGARCVKSWPWNPTSPSNSDGSSSKIGITHVVYKDGGKRTLEKVRETGGVVQCVGVGWVLDCERENEWLDEAPYYIDTSLVPRGGRNRRKSMEPKALANFNGTLVTPMKSNAMPNRECATVPNNHVSRRDSTVWMRTPSDHDEDEDAPGEHDWDMLTPVPKTPAPQDVARYAMDVTPDTPSTVNYGEGFSPEREELLTRTCPAKRSFSDLGGGLLKQEKDQGILMRLMAAKRKSMQFAPKVASPLSKAWN
ncbi:uncharacterized protein F4822DRAFT_418708 [Hypoxylon trugodes]|uniref:uncharacterized protein n=1 Tax=Hypoxylon trugodes TaxID=326681 RepID=UPI00219690AB|nr:uncharacterized protein F4822DRAFT_418708 [Hypoxylon trugodes]KAI1384119.1 hypothetical protein F4822DRAFT_418708 [Hypoxylon trugodes]